MQCKLCNHFCKTNAALKAHSTKKKTDGGCKQKPIDRSGTQAELAVKRLRRQQRQKDFDHVKIGDHVLENLLSFTYLGSNFEADPWKLHTGRQNQNDSSKETIWISHEYMVVKQDPTEAEVEAVQSWCAVSADSWTHKLDLKCKITEHNQGLELQMHGSDITDREVAEEY